MNASKNLTVQGVETTNEGACLRAPLAKWVELNDRLGREWMNVNDAPWWYNERASLSVFAGAVWNAQGAAFEEYCERKRTKGAVFPGRVDIWFSIGSHEFWGEAKFCHLPITRTIRQRETMAEWLRLAKKDARRCIPDGFTRRVALLFCSPYMRPCTAPDRMQCIAGLIEEARSVAHDGLAWVFPKLNRLPCIRGWESPGTLLMVKEVKR